MVRSEFERRTDCFVVPAAKNQPPALLAMTKVAFTFQPVAASISFLNGAI
jgi:hypothetical protein